MNSAEKTKLYIKTVLSNRNINIVLICLFTLVTIFSGVVAAHNLTNNSDGNVYPYLFSDLSSTNQMILSSKHSNLLKFPFFFIQSVLPINFVSYMAETTILFIVTIFSWVFISIYILGKKSLVPILLSATFLMIASPLFNNEIIYTTVRNIEYPLMLLFFVMISYLIFNKNISKRWAYGFSAIYTLIIILITGDTYFVYIIIPSLIISIGIVWLIRRTIDKRLILAGGLIGLLVPLSYTFREILDKVGLYDLDKAYLSGQTFYIDAKKEMAKAIVEQNLQLLNIRFTSIETIVVSMVVVAGVIIAITGAVHAIRSIKLIDNNKVIFVTVSLLVASALVIVAYFASGLSVVRQGPGAYASSGNTRYITLIPIVIIFAIGYSAEYLKIKHKRSIFFSVAVATVIVAPIALAQTMIIDRQNTLIADSGINVRVKIASVLKKAEVNTILTGYWYGSSLRLWMGENSTYAVVAECNTPSPLNTLRSWYAPSAGIKKTALVVDMSGGDLPFLGYCGENKLKEIYGSPIETKRIETGPKINNHIDILIYNYDIRTKLHKIDINR